MEDTTDRTDSYRKLSKSCHVTGSRRKVELDNAPNSAVSPNMNTDSRGSTLVEAPRHSNTGSKLRRSERIAKSRREATVPNLAATSVRPRGSYAVKDGQPIEKRMAAPSENHLSKISKPFHRRPSPKPTNSSGGREKAIQEYFQSSPTSMNTVALYSNLQVLLTLRQLQI